MTLRVKHFYEFGEYRMESGEKVLTRAGKPVALTPKASETLLALLEEHGSLVTKDELMARVWPDSFVE